MVIQLLLTIKLSIVDRVNFLIVNYHMLGNYYLFYRNSILVFCDDDDDGCTKKIMNDLCKY